MGASNMDFPDLSRPMQNAPPSPYPDLSQPLQSRNSMWDQALSYARNILPQPQLPLGMSVASGLMDNFFSDPNQKKIIRSFPSIIQGHPPSLSENIASGIGESVLPLLAGGERLIPQAAAGGILGAMQAPPGQGVSEGLKSSLATLGLGKALPFVANLMRPVSREAVASQVQDFHDALEQKAKQGFMNVSDKVNARGINQVSIDPALVQSASEYFPNTAKSQKLINSALGGDYNSLRKLQADLWQRGTKGMSSKFMSDQNQAEEMFDLRDKINDGIIQHFQNSGSATFPYNQDLVNELTTAKSDYKNLQDLFYNKDMNRAIPNLVGSKQKVPKNFLDVIQENSAPMERLRQSMNAGSFDPAQRPVVPIQKYADAMDLRSKLKTLGIAGSVVGGGLGGAAAAWHFLKPERALMPQSAPYDSD